MKIKINGNEKEYTQEFFSIQSFLNEEKIEARGIAIALNQVFVPRNKYALIQLKNGDELDIVAPFQRG